MQARLIITKSKRYLLGYIIFAFVFLLWYFFGPYDLTGVIYTQQPVFSAVILLVFGGLLIYFLNEFINRKPYITLTDDGIELRHQGFFKWHTIDSFTTGEHSSEGSTTYYLELHFKKKPGLGFDVEDLQHPNFPMLMKAPPAVKVDITDLQKDHIAIISLIMQSKGNASLYYGGHHRK